MFKNKLKQATILLIKNKIFKLWLRFYEFSYWFKFKLKFTKIIELIISVWKEEQTIFVLFYLEAFLE